MPTASTSVRLRVLPAISTLVVKRASAESGGAVAPDHWTEGPHYPELPQLLAAGFAPDAVLLTPGDARQAASWLESLRRAPGLALLPIFLNRSFGEAVDALSDGVASTPEAAAPEAAAIAARAASLSRRETAEGDERLLAFLYLRPERVLTPVADWRDERIYRYPLADALGRFGEDSFLMLERLRRRGLLETAGLVERVHTCPSCSPSATTTGCSCRPRASSPPAPARWATSSSFSTSSATHAPSTSTIRSRG